MGKNKTINFYSVLTSAHGERNKGTDYLPCVLKK